MDSVIEILERGGSCRRPQPPPPEWNPQGPAAPRGRSDPPPRRHGGPGGGRRISAARGGRQRPPQLPQRTGLDLYYVLPNCELSRAASRAESRAGRGSQEQGSDLRVIAYRVIRAPYARRRTPKPETATAMRYTPNKRLRPRPSGSRNRANSPPPRQPPPRLAPSYLGLLLARGAHARRNASCVTS
jgi:hypothetical protein